LNQIVSKKDPVTGFAAHPAKSAARLATDAIVHVTPFAVNTIAHSCKHALLLYT
jgi:hypothetical protein